VPQKIKIMERGDTKVVLSGTYEGSYNKFRNIKKQTKNENKLKFIKSLLKKIKGDKL